MQHLDEGTIHSWLDGALNADEAAQVEAHVAECPQCAAAVAEARGFIAASSRILTALDHVPGGVVPVSPQVKWYNRAAWRAAAAVLVVAVGSLVVVRNSDRKAAGSPTMIDSVDAYQDTVQKVEISGAPSDTTVVLASPAATAARKPQVPRSVTPSSLPPSSVTSSGKPTVEADFSGKPVRGTSQPNVVARERARDEAVHEAIGGNAAVAPQVAGAVTATAQSARSFRVPGVTATVAGATEQSPLKVVGEPRMIGAKVTLYEVAPGDTVTFTEALNVHLDAMVVTGVGSPPLMGRAAGKSVAAPAQPVDAAVVSAPDSQIRVQAAGAPAARAAAPVPPLQVEVANGLTTIRWPDATTGNMLRLSGRMPVERLKGIKLRIERERAAAAAKKNP
jgi:hypothetical protein